MIVRLKIGCARCPFLPRWCRSRALRRKHNPGLLLLLLLQPSLRVRRSGSVFGNDFLRVGAGAVRGGGHVHAPARSTAGPARTAKWLVLQLGGGPGARCSPASLFISPWLCSCGPLSLLYREAAEIYSAASEGTDKVSISLLLCSAPCIFIRLF